jgi:hypothetical protein
MILISSVSLNEIFFVSYHLETKTWRAHLLLDIQTNYQVLADFNQFQSKLCNVKINFQNQN